ncbi:class I SAM-dependent methyltransferase [Diaphorobacter aerolatus]|uniref:class I SAM-dependent methyltransferase n=1 Tax=Diaphorobacter aerolatus TaxID=1288495 RepID=UPI001D03486E|nr:class I SAM-dependent methyltransferase [Diaphorobacter aerolatus]
MTQNIEDLHVYLRKIRPGERTSLSVIASLVHEGATVLDLGCGSGALGQYLHETLGCTSDGLTWSDAEAEHARPHYRQVEVADLENCNLLTLFSNRHYDYIVCADVLEHLRQPERILQACRQLLKPGANCWCRCPTLATRGWSQNCCKANSVIAMKGCLTAPICASSRAGLWHAFWARTPGASTCWIRSGASCPIPSSRPASMTCLPLSRAFC